MSEGKTLLSFGVFFEILYLFFVFVFFLTLHPPTLVYSEDIQRTGLCCRLKALN